jgi:hypothetical protein
MNNVPGAGDLGWGFDIFGNYGDSALKTQLFQMSGGTEWTDPISKVIYHIPDNIALSLVQKSDSNSQVFDTATAVQEYFAAKAKLEASYVGEFGAFSGAFNSAYQKDLEQIESFKYALYESQNIAWRLTLQAQSLAQLTAEVQAEIATLPAEFSKGSRAPFFRFLRKYGTHYVSRVAVGGRLYYYVAVEKSFTSDDAKIDGDVTLEYNALLVSGKAESQANWSRLGRSWVSNRTVHIEAVGGTPNSLLLAAPEYDDTRSAIFDQWVESIKTAPATMDFELRPIYNLMPAAKSAAMEAALRSYLSDNLLVVEARSVSLPYPEPPKPGQLPVITLGQPIQPDQPPQHNFGFQMVVWQPVDDNIEIYLNKYYSIDLYQVFNNENQYSAIFDSMLADIKSGNYEDPGCVFVLASFDWNWQAPPTSDFYAFLRSAGGGPLLEEWIEGASHPGSISGQNSLYILVGNTGRGPNLGTEALAKAGSDGGSLTAILSVRVDGLNLQPVNVSDAAKQVKLAQRVKAAAAC